MCPRLNLTRKRSRDSLKDCATYVESYSLIHSSIQSRVSQNKLKVKKAEGLTLSLDSIHDRLKGVGYKPYPVELDDETRNKTVTRAFISAQYGGSAFSTFPTISKEHLDRHKMNDWMFPNLSFNPYAPQMAGAPGLLFVAGDPKDDWPTIQRVIVGLDTNAWLYIGFYQMLRSASLTQEEWLRQDFKVSLSFVRLTNTLTYASWQMQNTWANYLHKKDLGRFVRARIALRIIHGRKPTKREMEEALSGKQTYTHITPEQILKAYNDGEEVRITSLTSALH